MKTITKALVRRVIQLNEELAVRKALYDELDMLTIQLQAEGFVFAELDGLTVELVNNFETTNTVFRPAGVKQFEVKVKRVK